MQNAPEGGIQQKINKAFVLNVSEVLLPVPWAQR